MNIATDLLLKKKGREDTRITDFQVWVMENDGVLIRENREGLYKQTFSSV